MKKYFKYILMALVAVIFIGTFVFLYIKSQPQPEVYDEFTLQRMDIRKTTVIKDPAGNIIGNRARVKVIKNKMAPPFRVAEFDIMYNEGISKAGSLLDVATDMGILEKRGSWFSLDGEQLGQGRDQTKALIAASPELQQKLMDRINAKIKGGEASAPMELPEESAEPAPAPEA